MLLSVIMTSKGGRSLATFCSASSPSAAVVSRRNGPARTKESACATEGSSSTARIFKGSAIDLSLQQAPYPQERFPFGRQARPREFLDTLGQRIDLFPVGRAQIEFFRG